MDNSSRNASVPSKHRELHEMLVTQGAGVEGLTYAPKYGCWFNSPHLVQVVGDDDAHDRIELAGLKWLLGREIYVCISDDGWIVRRRRNGVFQVWLDDAFDTLIDALLDAVKREVGND